MGRSSKSTLFLKECMSDALLSLMKDAKFEKITINEITERAGVNRSTWFRNFNSKEEAIAFKYSILWEQWAEEHHLAKRKSFSLSNAKSFFDFNYSIRPLHRIVYAAGLQSALYNAFVEIMSPVSFDDVPDSYESRFFSYGLFGFLDEWIRRDFKENPEELTKLFLDMMLLKISHRES